MSSEMPGLTRELVFMMLQFLEKEKYEETLHKLEQESTCFFNLKYFEELVCAGKWEESEIYLSAFTKLEDNENSRMSFFEIRKQKYMEALEKNDNATAANILMKELNACSSSGEVQDLLQLLLSSNSERQEKFSGYNTTQERKKLSTNLTKQFMENSVFHDKLEFLNLPDSLQNLILQRPKEESNFSIKYFEELVLAGNWEEAEQYFSGLTKLEDSQLSRITFFEIRKQKYLEALDGKNHGAAIKVLTQELKVFSEFDEEIKPSIKDLTDLTTLNNFKEHEKFANYTDERTERRRLMISLGRHIKASPLYSKLYNLQSSVAKRELPVNVVRTLSQDSASSSMDFHPDQQILLLVGTNMGDTLLWDADLGANLFLEKFQPWKFGLLSTNTKSSLFQGPHIAVTRVKWSPDGSKFGVSYSKHICHLYSFGRKKGVQQHQEIDCHVGKVQDLAFFHPDNKLLVITCGDDSIKVWDVDTAVMLMTFEGHEPVYCVCPSVREEVHLILSTSTDGKITLWSYNEFQAQGTLDDPDGLLSTLAFSADGKRLFSCGLGKSGATHMLEWNLQERVVKRTYQGFHGWSKGIANFDTIKNKYLVAGDSNLIKFWDMNNSDLLMTFDAGGNLPATPAICCNREATLLAVSTKDSNIKILASAANVTGAITAFGTLTKGEDKNDPETERSDKIFEEQEEKIRHLQLLAIQLANFYLLFQEVIFTTISNGSTSLVCRNAWFPMLISGVAASPYLGAMYLLGKEYLKYSVKQDANRLTSFTYNTFEKPRVVSSSNSVTQLQQGSHFDMIQHLDAIRSRQRKRIQYFAICMIFFVIFAIIIMFGCRWILCKGHIIKPIHPDSSCIRLCEQRKCIKICTEYL